MKKFISVNMIVNGVSADYNEFDAEHEVQDCTSYESGIIALALVVNDCVKIVRTYHDHPDEYLGEPVQCNCTGTVTWNDEEISRKVAV